MISEGEGSAGRRKNAGVGQGAGRSVGSRRNAGGGQGAGLRGQGGYGCGAAIYDIYGSDEGMTIDFQLETVAKGFPISEEEMIEGWEEELFGDLEEDWEEQFEEQLEEELSSDNEEGYSKAWGERMQDLARKALARRALARKVHQGVGGKTRRASTSNSLDYGVDMDQPGAGGKQRKARYSFDDGMGMDRQGARGSKRRAPNGNSFDDGVNVNQQGTGGRNRRAPAGDSVGDGVGMDEQGVGGRKGRAPAGNSSGVGADTDPWAVLATVEKRLTQKMDGDRIGRIAVQQRLDRMEAEQDRLKAEQKRLNEVVLVNLDNFSGKIGSLSKALSEVQAAVFSAHPLAYSAPQPLAYRAPPPHMAHMAPYPWLGVQPGFLPPGAAMGSGGVPRPHPDAGEIRGGFQASQHRLPFYKNAGVAAAAGVEGVQHSAVHLQQGGPAAGEGGTTGLQEGEAPPVLEWENVGTAGGGRETGIASAD